MKNLKRKLNSLIMCFSELVIGILLLFQPIGFTSGIIIAFGVVLTFIGIRNVFTYFRTEPMEASRQQRLFLGVIFSMGGLFCVFRSGWFLTAFPLLTILYGILMLLSGVLKIQWTADMMRLKQENWTVSGISTVLTLILAVIILANPFSTIEFLWKFVAVSLIVEALLDCLSVFSGEKQVKPLMK